jgi:hypothetical protein
MHSVQKFSGVAALNFIEYAAHTSLASRRFLSDRHSNSANLLQVLGAGRKR